MAMSRERLIRWEDPVAGLPQMRAMTGLEALRAIVAGTFAAPPMGAVMNMRIIEIEKGRAVFEAEAGEEHFNPVGTVHGGFALTVLDSALGCAVHSALPAGALYGTIDVHARLLRAITRETGVVRCEGTLVSISRTLGTSEARLTDRNGTLLATATTACAIRRPESDRKPPVSSGV